MVVEYFSYTKIIMKNVSCCSKNVIRNVLCKKGGATE